MRTRHRTIGHALAPVAPDDTPRICTICGAEHRRGSLVCSKRCSVLRDLRTRDERGQQQAHRFGALADPSRTAAMPTEYDGKFAPDGFRTLDFGAQFDWVLDFTATNRMERGAGA